MKSDEIKKTLKVEIAGSIHTEYTDLVVGMEGGGCVTVCRIKANVAEVIKCIEPAYDIDWINI